jgi:hypothetical protein
MSPCRETKNPPEWRVMDSFSAFQVVQIAIAIFLGNLLTFLVVKGTAVLERDGGPPWKHFAYAFACFMAVVVLIGSRG